MENELLRYDKDKTFVFIDFETENLCLNTRLNHPWQCAMIKVKGEQIIETYNHYLKWERPFHVGAEAAKKTHFDAEKVEKNGVDYKIVAKDVLDWTSSANYICGHNLLGFDVYFISAFYVMNGARPFGIAEKIIDTLAIARGIKTNVPFNPQQSSFFEYQYSMINTVNKRIKANTETLGKEFGIQFDPNELHDALNDLKLNIEIWNRLKFQIEI